MYSDTGSGHLVVILGKRLSIVTVEVCQGQALGQMELYLEDGVRMADCSADTGEEVAQTFFLVSWDMELLELIELSSDNGFEMGLIMDTGEDFALLFFKLRVDIVVLLRR